MQCQKSPDRGDTENQPALAYFAKTWCEPLFRVQQRSQILSFLVAFR